VRQPAAGGFVTLYGAALIEGYIVP